jgi:hypothetical protein
MRITEKNNCNEKENTSVGGNVHDVGIIYFVYSGFSQL